MTDFITFFFQCLSEIFNVIRSSWVLSGVVIFSIMGWVASLITSSRKSGHD